MVICDFNDLLAKSLQDFFVCFTVLSILIISIFLSIKVSVILGIFGILLFIIGCTLTIILLTHKEIVSNSLKKAKSIFGYNEFLHDSTNDCDVCGITQCPRHRITEESWRKLLINKDLDKSIEDFFNCILDNFVISWFTLFSSDEEFVHLLKMTLREASSRLIIKIKQINAPILLTNKLLPCFFGHYEVINKMLDDGITMDKLATTFIMDDRPIHPAVLNRHTEINYLRGIAKFLIPRLFKNDNFESKIFFSLIRETIACWVLLPLMDAISDPNLINLLIIITTNQNILHGSSGNYKKTNTKNDYKNVVFLENFTRKIETENADRKSSDDFLIDQTKLYNFMQFLKREGAVDILKFYLDVDNLNNELEDPKVTTDPIKLSALQQQSEKLLKTYQAMMSNELKIPITSLTEAHDDVKYYLLSKWKNAFHKTRGYFELSYGNNRDIKDTTGFKFIDPVMGPVSRFSSKIKVAIRGGNFVDGSPLEATEVATVWDGLSEPHLHSGHTQWHSVTQKLRKEKGQNLDAFMSTLMSSIEQTTDIGEDVIEMNEPEIEKPIPPGLNHVFGDLFKLRSTSKHSNTQQLSPSVPSGPSQCFIYILVRLLKAPLLVVRFAYALVCVSKETVDSIICAIVSKLIKIGLYQPRLATLINSLREIIFVEKIPEPTLQELLERQQLARTRLESLRKGLGRFSDTLQVSTLNKHLTYCLLDIILEDMYPELQTTK